ncbi:little elongation complex subunit 1 [Chanos chanos]|uniref:Little elongation complex subunit 1 n=1 Tax=Chanos chanos TaxID=29144 RepID=A0A6J2W4K3_CHACN|nr:little elongation complex subunit 1 [Chanos chanos]
MMPGENQSKTGGIASEATSDTCQNCTVLNQTLDDYVAAFLTLKQKIIDTDHLLSEYREKCDELQKSQRESSKLHKQLDEVLLKLSPLEKQNAEFEATKAELESTKAALKTYQKKSEEVDSLKEDNSRIFVLKERAEDSLKKAEETAQQQIHKNLQLNTEKKALEEELQKAKVSLKICQQAAEEMEALKVENAKTLILKGNLENQLIILEDTKLKQNQEITNLKNEKKTLEEKLLKTQQKLEKLEKEFCKEKKSTSSQTEAEAKVDKSKVRQLLEELWHCVEPRSSPNSNALHFSGYSVPDSRAQNMWTSPKKTQIKRTCQTVLPSPPRRQRMPSVFQSPSAKVDRDASNSPSSADLDDDLSTDKRTRPSVEDRSNVDFSHHGPPVIQPESKDFSPSSGLSNHQTLDTCVESKSVTTECISTCSTVKSDASKSHKEIENSATVHKGLPFGQGDVPSEYQCVNPQMASGDSLACAHARKCLSVLSETTTPLTAVPESLENSFTDGEAMEVEGSSEIKQSGKDTVLSLQNGQAALQPPFGKCDIKLEMGCQSLTHTEFTDQNSNPSKPGAPNALKDRPEKESEGSKHTESSEVDKMLSDSSDNKSVVNTDVTVLEVEDRDSFQCNGNERMPENPDLTEGHSNEKANIPSSTVEPIPDACSQTEEEKEEQELPSSFQQETAMESSETVKPSSSISVGSLLSESLEEDRCSDLSVGGNEISTKSEIKNRAESADSDNEKQSAALCHKLSVSEKQCEKTYSRSERSTSDGQSCPDKISEPTSREFSEKSKSSSDGECIGLQRQNSVRPGPVVPTGNFPENKGDSMEEELSTVTATEKQNRCSEDGVPTQQTFEVLLSSSNMKSGCQDLSVKERPEKDSQDPLKKPRQGSEKADQLKENRISEETSVSIDNSEQLRTTVCTVNAQHGTIEDSSNSRNSHQDEISPRTVVMDLLKHAGVEKGVHLAGVISVKSLNATPSPESLGKARAEMGPPLRPVVMPLTATPPRFGKYYSPLRHVPEKLSSPLAVPISPLQQTSVPQDYSEKSPCLGTSSPNCGVPSSPLQFGSATPKHAVPVPGRLPSSAICSSSPSSSQENSMQMLDTMYPELSARARTLNILRGNVNLNRPSSENKTPPPSVSQISGNKTITSSSTAFTKTEQKGKRTGVSMHLPKSAKRLRLDNCSPVPSDAASPTELSTNPQPVDKVESPESPNQSIPAASFEEEHCARMPPKDDISNKQLVISEALKKVETSCFDVLPVIKSHVFLGRVSQVPVLRDEEKAVISNFCTTHQSFAEDFLSAILSKMKAEKSILSDDHLQCLCRVYTGICRQRKDWQKVHALAYSVLKEDFPNAAKLILFMVTTWPSVLSHQSAVCKAVHTVTNLKAEGEILEYLTAYLNWDKNPPFEIQQIISRSLRALQEDKDLKFQSHERHGEDLCQATWDYVFAVDLLCAHQKWKWTHDNIIGKELWPVMNTWVTQPRSQQTPIRDISVAAVLRLIGRLGQLGIKEKLCKSVQNVANAINLFGKHGKAEGVPWTVQLSAIYAIYDLSPSNPKNALDALASWRGDTTQPVPPAVTSCITQIGSLCRQIKS